MLGTLLLIGLLGLPAWLYRSGGGGPVPKMPAAFVLGGAGLLVLWILHATGDPVALWSPDRGGPSWLYGGILIAYWILTTGRSPAGAPEVEEALSPKESGVLAAPGGSGDAPADEERTPVPGPEDDEESEEVAERPGAPLLTPRQGWALVGAAVLLGIVATIGWHELRGSSEAERSGGAASGTVSASAWGLWSAIERGNAAVLHAFLQEGGSPDESDPQGNSALINAAMFGQSELVEILLQWGADPDRTGLYGTVPLAEAAARGYDDIVEALLAHGASTDIQGELGATPLYLAVMAGEVRVAERLLEAGADPDLSDVNGVTPLVIATSEEHEELTALLERYGAS